MFWSGQGDGEVVVTAYAPGSGPGPTAAVINRNTGRTDEQRAANAQRWTMGIGTGLSALGAGLMGAYGPPAPPAAPTAGTILLLGGAGVAVGLLVSWVARG
jgi:hypothetical protein